jgi:hypothetical protein
VIGLNGLFSGVLSFVRRSGAGDAEKCWFVIGYRKLVENRKNGGSWMREDLLYQWEIEIDSGYDQIRIRLWEMGR